MRMSIALAAFLWALPASAQQLPEVHDAMQALVDKGELAGVATVVWQDGKLVDRSAIGSADRERGTPMHPDTIVRAFSMTKPVTGVAMMILWDEGKWKADEPVANYLPELSGLKVYRGMDAAGQPILETPKTPPTMGQLMAHTAGFRYDFGEGWLVEQYRAADLWHSKGMSDFVARMARLPLGNEPGTEWHYSASMDLEGAIVERLSGLSLADFMEQRIFAPLAMHDTGFRIATAKLPRLAAAYQWKDGRLQRADLNLFGAEPDQLPGFLSGGGGLFSTADDYSRFARMLLNRGALDGVRIISTAAANEMMSNHLSPAVTEGGFGIGLQQMRPGYQYGYNGAVVTDPAAAKVAIGRGSYLWDGLASTWFWVDPEHRIAFVGMVQRVAGPDVPLLQPISQAAIRDSFYPEEP